MSVLRELWYGDGIGARIARVVLAPASWLYGAAVGRRADMRRSVAQRSRIPVISIGNLTVGGTGKTPIAAWVAATLRSRGASPAIVMRGYGADEPLVHARLNPHVPVIVDVDRAHGVETARERGADCAILDDGFQHHRVARSSDWVLVSAEQWREGLQLLPAGPLREPLRALERADIAVVTRKHASRAEAEGIADRLASQFPHIGVSVCHLRMDALVDARSGERLTLDLLAGRSIGATAAIGEPHAFLGQLRDAGATVHARTFRDHHDFSAADLTELTALASYHGGLVCTLKDAVKLAPIWPPAAAPLWYVSQITAIEQGRQVLDDALKAVLAARPLATSNAG